MHGTLQLMLNIKTSICSGIYRDAPLTLPCTHPALLIINHGVTTSYKVPIQCTVKGKTHVTRIESHFRLNVPYKRKQLANTNVISDLRIVPSANRMSFLNLLIIFIEQTLWYKEKTKADQIDKPSNKMCLSVDGTMKEL